MTCSPRFRIALVLALTVFSFASLSAAQTLEHRPAPKPNEPTEAQSPVLPVLPKGTSLQVETSRHYPMKAGEAIEARLLHPIFCRGDLAVPANTPLRGRVVSLGPDTKTRWHGRLRGDFTPFHTVQVQFEEMMLPSGPLVISTTVADNGAPVLRLSAPGALPKQSLLSRQWTRAKSNLHDRVEYITAPGKADRALQLLYHQLPYHPERIDAQTAWSFELTAPLDLPNIPAAGATPTPPPPVSGKSEIWSVHATLSRDLTSATASRVIPLRHWWLSPSSIGTETWLSHKDQSLSAGSQLPKLPGRWAETASCGLTFNRCNSQKASTNQSKDHSQEQPPKKPRICPSMPKARSPRATRRVPLALSSSLCLPAAR